VEANLTKAKPAPAARKAGLTLQQNRCLEAIKMRIADTGRPPSVAELMFALGLASKSGVFRLLNALEERGHIVRLRNRARSIIIVEPMTRCPHCQGVLSEGAQ